jgi:hypothetical protein
MIGDVEPLLGLFDIDVVVVVAVVERFNNAI